MRATVFARRAERKLQQSAMEKVVVTNSHKSCKRTNTDVRTSATATSSSGTV